MKKNKLFFIFIILIIISILLLLSNNSIENFDTTESYDIIIIGGQSNACGRGTRNACDSTRLPGCTSINLRRDSTRKGVISDIPNMYEFPLADIKQFSGNYTNRDTSLNNKIIGNVSYIEDIQPRFNNITPIGNSFGYEFSREYLLGIARPNKRKVLIVGCGYGGSSMGPSVTPNNMIRHYWKVPNGTTDNEEYSLYKKTIKRLQTLKEVLGPNNRSQVVAFLWHQGESDAGSAGDPTNPRNANNYKSALKSSLSGMRTAIMNIFNQTYVYPIMLGGLNPDRIVNRITNVPITPYSFFSEMSRIISEVSNEKLPNNKTINPYYIPKSIFIPTGALSNTGSYNFTRKLEGDSNMDASGNIIHNNTGQSHFSATSNRELGKRYFYFYNMIK